MLYIQFADATSIHLPENSVDVSNDEFAVVKIPYNQINKIISEVGFPQKTTVLYKSPLCKYVGEMLNQIK